MAFGAVGGAGLFQDTSAGTSITGTVTATIEAGNVALVVVALDNLGSSDGDNSEVTSVVDSSGVNVYTKLAEWTNANGSAGAGATVSLWYSILTNQLTSTVGTVTANFSGSPTASAMIVHEFTIGAGNVIQVAGSTSLSNDAADPGSMTLSSLPVVEYLFVRGIASESNNTATITTSGSYTSLGRTVANTGTSSTSIGARGEFRILTSSSSTSDPTLFSADHANVFVALIEAAPATPIPVFMATYRRRRVA